MAIAKENKLVSPLHFDSNFKRTLSSWGEGAGGCTLTTLKLRHPSPEVWLTRGDRPNCPAQPGRGQERPAGQGRERRAQVKGKVGTKARSGEAGSGRSREMASGEVRSERGSTGARRRRVWGAGEAGGAGGDGEGCQGWGLRYPRDSQGKALGRGGARGPAASPPHSSAVTPGSERPLPRRRWRRRRTPRPRLLLPTGTGAGAKPGRTEAGLSPVPFRRLHTGSPPLRLQRLVQDRWLSAVRPETSARFRPERVGGDTLAAPGPPPARPPARPARPAPPRPAPPRPAPQRPRPQGRAGAAASLALARRVTPRALGSRLRAPGAAAVPSRSWELGVDSAKTWGSHQLAPALWGKKQKRAE